MAKQLTKPIDEENSSLPRPAETRVYKPLQEAIQYTPESYYHYANNYYPGHKPTRPWDGNQDPIFPYYAGQHLGRPAVPDPGIDGTYFFGRFHANGGQVNPEDDTLVRFQILDHRLMFPEGSDSLSQFKARYYSSEAPYQTDQRIGTKYYRPRVFLNRIQVSDFFRASRTKRHRLSPSIDYLEEDEEPNTLSAKWYRLFWNRSADRLDVRPEEPLGLSLMGPYMSVSDLWKRVIRDTVRSSCDTKNGHDRFRRTNGFVFDEGWDPQAYEHERMGLFAETGGDPSNLDGYFKEFTSPRCPIHLVKDRWPFLENEFPDVQIKSLESEPWSLELNETASVVPKWPLKSPKPEGPQTRTCKFSPSSMTDFEPGCDRFSEAESKLLRNGQEPSGGYLSLVTEWRVVTGWIVITDVKTNTLKEQHLVQVEVPELLPDGSLQGETLCHCTF
ncbi:hypothetical protein BGZ83_010079 [Gryganskiella cystojenkinii]|nr:hypothetical protein BGZ83_010079 [Gryganskiella cystojenkinii]